MIKYFTGVAIIFALSSCYVQNRRTPFNIKGAYYQSWMESTRNKGTRVTLILTEVNSAVKFDSIIFRGSKVPVSFTNRNDSISLTAIIPEEGTISPIVPTYTCDPNQLIYQYKGIRCSLLLKNVKRADMDYMIK